MEGLGQFGNSLLIEGIHAVSQFLASIPKLQHTIRQRHHTASYLPGPRGGPPPPRRPPPPPRPPREWEGTPPPPGPPLPPPRPRLFGCWGASLLFCSAPPPPPPSFSCETPSVSAGAAAGQRVHSSSNLLGTLGQLTHALYQRTAVFTQGAYSAGNLGRSLGQLARGGGQGLAALVEALASGIGLLQAAIQTLRTAGQPLKPLEQAFRAPGQVSRAAGQPSRRPD